MGISTTLLAVLVLGAFCMGFGVSKLQHYLHMKDLAVDLARLNQNVQHSANMNYTAGFSQCAKYVVHAHGRNLTEAQLLDLLNEVKRVCNSYGVKY